MNECEKCKKRWPYCRCEKPKTQPTAEASGPPLPECPRCGATNVKTATIRCVMRDGCPMERRRFIGELNPDVTEALEEKEKELTASQERERKLADLTTKAIFALREFKAANSANWIQEKLEALSLTRKG